MLNKLCADFMEWPAWVKTLLLIALTTLTLTATVVAMVLVIEVVG